MKSNQLLFLFIALILFSCRSNRVSSSGASLSQQLTGEWRNTYVKLTMNSFKNSDTSRVVEADENNWEHVLKSRTVRTFFRADGTYNSEHRDLKDSLFYNPAGHWHIVGDSLFMKDSFPQKGISYQYHLSIKDKMATFRGLGDYDLDGRSDDEYFGVQRKQ